MQAITHHWLDATHITFGVVTAGIYTARWKAEASAFNGREPDASRADFDLAALDSFSGRLSVAPAQGIVLQVSGGHLHEAEAGVGTQPRIDVNRITASATYHRSANGSDVWATTLAYGVNSETDVVPGGLTDLVTHAVLLETRATRHETHTWFGRLEVVGKPAHDLHAHEFITRVFTVGKIEAARTEVWRSLRARICVVRESPRSAAHDVRTVHRNALIDDCYSDVPDRELAKRNEIPPLTEEAPSIQVSEKLRLPPM